MEKRRVLIIGGGASGLTAGIFAARAGASVTILEQNEKPGKKICATGNGKCNLTNLAMPLDAYRGTHPEFARPILEQFTVQDTIRFFFGAWNLYSKQKWLPLSQKRTGRQCNGGPLYGSQVSKNQDKNKRACGHRKKEGKLWKVRTKSWTYEGDALILANGSKASAVSGSDGSGYLLAESLGHTIIPPLPALCALKCSGRFSVWAGVRTEGEVTLLINGIPLKKERGELQLTEYGISGIPIFQLSRYAVRALQEGCEVSLLVNFLPEFEEEGLWKFLDLRRKSCPYKTEDELLTGLFPKKLAGYLGSQPDPVQAIRALPLKVKGGMPFSQAQVCSGGVSTEEVHSHTLESKLHNNLYFAGELLDIDGACGGYNLQWAWSSGAAAGRYAAKEQL